MKGLKLPPGFSVYDPADYIVTPEDVFAHLEVVLEENDPQLLLAVLGDIARSKGMALLAKELNVSRECFYTSFSAKGKGNPSFKAVAGALRSFGLQLTVKPIVPAVGQARRRAAKKAGSSASKKGVTARSVKKRAVAA